MKTASFMVLGTSPKALAFWNGGATPAKKGAKSSSENRATLAKVSKLLNQTQKNADKLQKLISKGSK